LTPESTDNHHLSPKEWHDAMGSDSPKLVIDTRNRYETMAGRFSGAVDPNLKTFSD
jgi:predicted sulfurtransferase